MWKYRKELIVSKDIEPIDIVKEMNAFGENGWEVFSLNEEIKQHTKYGDVITTTYYTLYMKKFDTLSKRAVAMNWWNELAALRKTQICDTNTNLIGFVRRWETLTGREIEMLYEAEC